LPRWVGAQGMMTSSKNPKAHPSYEVTHKKQKSKTSQFKKKS